ncbi:MAG TPA: hypothetical protein VGM17_13240, partial [Rhizomicrobium sp.]
MADQGGGAPRGEQNSPFGVGLFIHGMVPQFGDVMRRAYAARLTGPWRGKPCYRIELHHISL